MENSNVEATSRHFQSIDVPESPVNKKQGNLTGSPRIVQDSAADLHNFIQEWNTEHLTGIKFISEISILKSSHFKLCTKSPYPQGLQQYCDKLEEVCQKLETVVLNIKKVINHIEGVLKLRVMKKDFTPIFTTWKIDEYAALSKRIYEMYAKELQLKLYIKENIAHSESAETVIFYQVLWAQQPYIDNLDLQIEAMLKETNLRQ